VGIIVSGKAILKEYAKRIHLKKGSYSTLLRTLENREELVCNTVDELSVYLDVGITNMINFFNPELIVIDGKTPKIYPKMVEVLEEVVSICAIDSFKNNISIVPNGLQSDARIMGDYLNIKRYF